MVNNPFLERFLQRPHWFQETQFVNYDDSLQMQAKLGSFSLEVKWVGAYAYTLGCIEEMNRGRSIMGWLDQCELALPVWPQCPLLPRRPDEVPQMAASSCLLANGGLLFYLLLEENSLSLWVCCGSNKLPLFLPTLKHYKKQQSGQVIAFWEESHKSEHNGGKRQLYLCTRTCACVCFF